MNKTAIQELIELLKELQLDAKKSGATEFQIAMTFAMGRAETKLEKEKEQIMNAYSDGQEMPVNHPTLPHYSREEYYNDNYNQKK